MAVHVRRTDSTDDDFSSLAGRLTEYLSVLNGEQDAFFAQHNRTDLLATVVVACVENVPLGCGVFRAKSPDTVEIKRMFVDPEARGQGIAAAILAELESWAAERGYQTAILETSKRLKPAVRLYKRSGYEVIDNYEPYVGIEDSVCMRKALGVRAPGH